MAEFRARAIDIAGSKLHHTKTPKFDIWPDLDPKLKVNLKILSMLWEDLAELLNVASRGTMRPLVLEIAGGRIRPPMRSWVRK